MRPVPYREVKRKLEAAGFIQVGQTGSHVKFAKSTTDRMLTATVPNHREVAPVTLRSILRQAHLTFEEFEPTVNSIRGRCRQLLNFNHCAVGRPS